MVGVGVSLRKHHRDQLAEAGQAVSILIHLEEALEEEDEFLLRVVVGSFNPYSSGRGTGRAARRFAEGRQYRFQSLFIWKRHWKGRLQSDTATISPGFNPYSSGRGTGRSILPVGLRLIEMFQ
jgi:hypothetical protein